MKKSKAVIEKENFELREENNKLSYLARTRLQEAEIAAIKKDVAEASTKASELYIVALCEMLEKPEVVVTREMLHEAMKSRAAIDVDPTNGDFSICILHGDEAREPSEAQRLLEIAKFYGINTQLEKAKEELQELIDAIDEYIVDGGNDLDCLDHVSEEIADVEVTTKQIKMLLGVGKDVEKMRAYKIERQIFRMKHSEAEAPDEEVQA